MSDREKLDIIAKDKMAQAGPGHDNSPLKVPADKLRSYLGVWEVNYVQGHERPAIVDKPRSA
jgi:hypothetical protein